MDRKGFLLRSQPDLIFHPSPTIVNQETTREINATKTVPPTNSRYPGYAGIMEDGHFITDYRQACVGRAPPGTQYSVKEWTVSNSEEIIRISRNRQAQSTGQVFGTANTEIPPLEIQQCSTDSCSIRPTFSQHGLGIERTDKAPALFGTFQVGPDPTSVSKNRKNIDLNEEIRYGRNTPTRWVNLYQ
jgi:hypothetical protein